MLTKMFTVTAEDDGCEDSACALLFHKENERFTEAELGAIASNPTCRKLMGDLALMTRTPCNGGEELLLSRELDRLAIAQMPSAAAGETVLLFEPLAGLRQVNLRDVYYKCTLPHRTIVGCVDCLLLDTKGSCELKKLWNVMEEEDIATEACDAVGMLNSRKSKIEGFTYVSPSLTRDQDFVTPYRHHKNHDFSCVEGNSEIVRKGLRERGRARRFVKNACSTCLVKDACDRSAECSHIKYCRGPYAETAEEANSKVVEAAKIPFTEKQLMFLALNSGKLQKRYERCIYWATFRYNQYIYRGMSFGLCRATTGEYTPFKTFKEAEAVIRKCNASVVEVEKREKLTVEQKAVLIELAKAHQSPAYRGGWNTRHYDTLGIEFNQWGGSWDLRFKYNSSGGYGYRTDGMLLPWMVDAKTLADVFQHYIGLGTLEHKSHADSYYNTHK